MRLITLFSLFIVMVSNFAQANFDKVCEDLGRFTCAPGEYDDGTGLVTSSNIISRSMDAHTKTVKLAASEFKKVIKDPDNAYFRKIVLSTTGLSLNPECEGAEEKPNEACLKLMSEGAADILARMNLAQKPSGPSKHVSSIPDIVYLVTSDEFKKTQEAILKNIRKEFGDDELKTKIQSKIFPQVKSLLISKIDDMIKDPETKKHLIEKVRAIRFDGTNCSSNYGSSETVSSLLIPNANYNPIQNTFKYCTGLGLTSNSEFQMAYIIAHELSHSIDPCCITQGPSDFVFKYKAKDKKGAEEEFPFSGVLGCLRSNKSVGAIDNSQMQFPTSGQYGGPSMPYGPVPPASSNPTAPTPQISFCSNDQIGESFSDWMATEITPDYINKNFPKLTAKQIRFGYSNALRIGCEADFKSSQGFDPHPDLVDRVNKIILANPKVRKGMDCPEKIQDREYCAIGKIMTDGTPNNMSPAFNTVAPQLPPVPNKQGGTTR